MTPPNNSMRGTRLSTNLLCTLAVACVLTVVGCQHLTVPDSREFDAASYQLYYGHDNQQLQRLAGTLREREVLIIDSRKISPPLLRTLLQRAAEQNARVIGYLSIGELDSRERAAFDAFAANQPSTLQQDFPSLALEWNEKFASWRIDVSAPLWQHWLQYQYTALRQQGLHGVFLDTPDTVDRYLTHPDWSRAQKVEKVRAMIELIRSFKQQHPQDFVLLNRGLNLIGEAIWLNEDGSDTIAGLALMQAHPDNPDAVLYENAYASDDPWTQRIEADLRATAATGRTQVFTLGYRDTIGDVQRFFRRNNADGFIGSFAASSTSLHQAGTEPAPTQ
jgi:polysaccharide biosynthesis protein PelA